MPSGEEARYGRYARLRNRQWQQYSQNFAHYPPGYARPHDTRLVVLDQTGDHIMEEEMIDE